MKVKFWGVRGSIPTPGSETAGIGGNTSCVEVRTDDNILLVFDAGTGIRALGLNLMKEGFDKGGKTGHIFFSHTHWDHIQGFPFFAPAFVKGRSHFPTSDFKVEEDEPALSNTFNFYGAKKVFEKLENTLRGQMEYQYFPISLDQMGATIKFHEIQDEPIKIGENRIIPGRLNHPNGALGYRVENVKGNKVVVYATDTEHYNEGDPDPQVFALARNADVFIYDSQYTPEEYIGDPAAQKRSKIGWGHSTWREGTRLAKAAGVKQYILFHHDPSHDDKFLYEIEEQAQSYFPNSRIAYEGLEIIL
jgi:phosphoribosyl 1,2-cyclic phosphodiesterase